MQPFLSTSRQQTPIPDDQALEAAIAKERQYLEAKKLLDLKIPHNFEPTAPAFNPDVRWSRESILENRKFS